MMTPASADEPQGVLPRTAEARRDTRETQLSARLCLDGTGQFSGSLGVPFFEHMLHAFTRHAGFDLAIDGKGDLQIDAHHTVEDFGILLGQLLKQAAGDKAGMARYGAAYCPMEETLVRCALDFCNRPYLHHGPGPLAKGRVGEFDCELGEEFFRALAMNAGLTMHLDVLRGSNLHHLLEAQFKACGLALRQACARNSGVAGVLSTKGSIS